MFKREKTLAGYVRLSELELESMTKRDTNTMNNGATIWKKLYFTSEESSSEKNMQIYILKL